ncbi:unnamed protein product [Ilex paraguariensis]|uniref:Uncharacterized protein n=1 Tax=Ilex paraguariensis TaxID=185542 RepID=A0ABC8SVP0_9AQUA
MNEPSLVLPHPSTLAPAPLPPSLPTRASSHPVHKTLASAGNLASLLPTGTVLAFQALSPLFSNKGTCQLANTYLTASLIGFCVVVCVLSSFTDSFVDSDGKLYFGIATFKGLYIFNYDNHEGDKNNIKEELIKFKISCIDFIHAFTSLFVFLIFAFSDSDVQNCFFPKGGANENVLLVNLPLGAGVLSSFLFIIFPTTRRGIGCADHMRP